MSHNNWNTIGLHSAISSILHQCCLHARAIRSHLNLIWQINLRFPLKRTDSGDLVTLLYFFFSCSLIFLSFSRGSIEDESGGSGLLSKQCLVKFSEESMKLLYSAAPFSFIKDDFCKRRCQCFLERGKNRYGKR